jgi:putative ABC transport system permease protein
MLRNYLKITFRNIVRNKLFTTINILGLSVSIASCLLIFLYVSEQLSYDKQHGNNVYRITSLLSQNSGNSFNAASCSVPVAPAIQMEIPEVEGATRIISTGIMGGKDMITVGTESFFVKDGAAADSNVFQILKYNIIQGSEERLLSNGNSIVLEKEWAEKLFGEQQALGKVLKLSTLLGPDEYQVTGIYDKKTYNTHFAPSYFISTTNSAWKQFLNGMSSSWVGNNLTYTYAKLADGSNPKDIEEKIDVIFRRNGAEEMKAMGANKVMSLQPVSDIHTTTSYMAEAADVISLTFIQVLMSIGIMIILLACVNYINLSTAQAGNRSLEVGIRKVMGITSKGLIIQFLGESFVIVFISMLFSILLAELSIPLFNNMVEHPVSLNANNLGELLGYMGIFLVFTAFVAGIYPAFYLASFKPTAVLKGRNKDRGGVAILRKLLVTFQFIISIVLISAILVISDQVNFIKTKDLGYDVSSKIVVPLTTTEAQEKFKNVKQEFLKLATVSSVTGGSTIPGMPIANDLGVYKKGQTMDDAIHIFNNDVDKDFINTLGIKLIAGNNFSETNVLDTLNRSILINREAMVQLGFDQEKIAGERVYFDWRGDKMEFNVVGIIEDFNQFSLHESVAPMMLSLRSNSFGNVILEANMEDLPKTIEALENVWKTLLPETPFESFTLNDHLTNQYQSDFKTFNLIIYFAFISVFISCMGLYALSMYIAERRFKEIGVRKALGANVSDIVILVSKDLSLLVLIAFMISVPLSIYGMNMWLDTFAYKITPGITTYIIAGSISILIGWLTISYQSVRAARTNPVDVLKDE